MEDLSDEIIMEEKEELMVPLNGGVATLRRARFLKPVATVTKSLPSPSMSFKTIAKLKQGLLKVDFRGRRCPQKRWRKWFDQLQPKYQHIWEKAGIFEGVLASTYKILRDNELVIKLAERWSEETNTFIFPWGEATLTLEDMMVLGGYAVSGESVLVPERTEDLVGKQEGLNRAWSDVRLKSKLHGASDNEWMDHFIGSDDPLEHEAFISLWLSRYVFPLTYCVVGKHVFILAVYLCAGTQIALAPAVLASIYRDLTLLKKSMVGLVDESKVVVWAPFQLVQLWAWERFPSLGPIPNTLKCGEPRAARWHTLRKPKIGDVREALGSSGKTFRWRPYTTVLRNWNSSKFYWENEEYVVVRSELDTKIDSFVRCLRASGLVGVDSVEHYLPHRVAMQFGFDQDVPGYVCVPNQSPSIAWESYIRPITHSGLYIPPRLLEPDVAARYVEWWDQMRLMTENSTRGIQNQRGLAKDDQLLQVSQGGSVEGNIMTSHTVVPGFDRVEVDAPCDEEDRLTISEVMRRRKMRLNNENMVFGQIAFSAPQSSSLSAVFNGCCKGRESPLTKPVELNANVVPEGENSAQEENVQMTSAKLDEPNIVLPMTDVPGMELEARLENLEKILDLIKDGKLVFHKIRYGEQ